MLRPVVNITIDSLRFKGCVSFKIERDVDSLSTKGVIVLPLRAVMYSKGDRQYIRINESIKAGQRVSIQAGNYDLSMHDLFDGYITNIEPGDNLKIYVEDAVYLLRKQAIIINEKNITVNNIAKEIVKGTDLKVSDNCLKLKVDRLSFKGNAAGLLAKVKEQLNLTVYVDNDEVFIGGKYLNNKETIKVRYGKNIIKQNLKYQYQDANPLQIEMIGKMIDGTEVKVLTGMEGGSKMTFHKYNVSDTTLLKQMADDELKRYSFDGFKGDVTLMFLPFVELGGALDYDNSQYEFDVAGTYHVDGIAYSFTCTEGLKQRVKIGAKL